MGREIRIIGGGLAGLTLGVMLRRAGIPVEIWDAGQYPRHKVCGEFISGRGIAILRTLEINGFPESVGENASTVQFFDSARSSAVIRLPEPALAIDRARLDEMLANEFRRRGGVLHLNSRWTDGFAQEGVVRATGRRLHRKAKNGFVGVKAHARNLPIDADLEMHFSRQGYVGLSRLPDGRTNVCALFREGKDLRDARRGEEGLRAIFMDGMRGPLVEKLRRARFDTGTFAAVTGISLARESECQVQECRIGDSICMVPPMTGNGMSMAMETAAIAAPLLCNFFRGQADWEQTVGKISQRCDKRLRRRLASAAILQKLCFVPAGRIGLLAAIRMAPRTLNCWFWLTR